MTTEERLEELERQFARAKRQNLWLVGGVVVAVVGFGLALAGIWTKTTAIAQDHDKGGAAKVICANELILEDPNGKRRALFVAGGAGPMLSLFDEKAQLRVCLSLLHDLPALRLDGPSGGDWVTLAWESTGPELNLYDYGREDRENRGRATLGVGGTVGPRLNLSGLGGNPRAVLNVNKNGTCLTLTDEKGKTRTMVGVDNDGPAVNLCDKEGRGRATLGVGGTVGLDGTKTQHPESSLWLFGADGKALWSAP